MSKERYNSVLMERFISLLDEAERKMSKAKADLLYWNDAIDRLKREMENEQGSTELPS